LWTLYPKGQEARLSMSYELLVAIVAINAIVTLSLWRMIATKASRPAGLNKKAAKALWHSDPITPRHDPPKVHSGRFSSLHSDKDQAFFLDFQEFADVVNRRLATLESRFRLQELPEDHLRLNLPDDQPAFGRSFAIYYNQTPVGRLEISPGFPYTTQTPYVSTSVEIDWSRFLGYRTITEFLDTIASDVTNPSPKSDEYVSARQGVQAALMEMLLDKYGISEFDRVFANEEDLDWGELNVSFHGAAEGYIKRRAAWRESPATPSL
jgi:hypothetical protein